MTRGGFRMDAERENYVAHTLRSEGADASEDGTGRGTPLVVAEELWRQTCGCGHGFVGSLSMPCPSCGMVRDGETHGDPIAFSCKDSGADAGELAPTLRAMGHRDSWENGGGQVAVAYPIQEVTGPQEKRQGSSGIGHAGAPMYTLQAGFQHGVGIATGVRRLTPRECERLQGYPDDWTRYGADGKELSDSARYRMIGNGVTASVARWIGERVSVADEAAIAEEAIPIRGIADIPLSAHDSLEMRNPVTVGLLGETATGRRLRRG